MTTATVPATTKPSAAAAPTTLPAPNRYVLMSAVRRFTVDEYHRLIEQGFFAADERFELLDGLIIRKMPRDPIHDACYELTQAALAARVPPGWRVRGQCAITTDGSQPEPDLVVVRGQPRDHAGRHPGAQDLAVVVEVANTSLAEDRAWKGSIYARAAIVTYWIVNLINSRVEVYTDPSGPDAEPAYRRRQDYGITDAVPLVIDGADRGPAPVRDLIP